MADGRKFVTTAPENSEMPLESIRSWVTPNRLFFVRNHFAMPEVNLSTWRLGVEGLVERPREWTYEELGDLPERTVFATVECAGNGRSFLQPVQAGVQWGAGALGHAEWTGVPLRVVLHTDAFGTGPYGAKHVGELGNPGIGAAVANAVADATGLRLRHLPITSERLWSALADGRPAR